MISSINSSDAVAQLYFQNQQVAKPPAKPKDTQQPDTVTLSAKAIQAAGDIDHDGDSH